MPTIHIIHPFSLRPATGAEERVFAAGQHTVTSEELGHWFMQGCLKEGRAVLVAEPEPDDDAGDNTGELVSPTRPQLNALNRDTLDELALACGLNVPEGANKAAVIDLLLAGQEGVTLVKGPAGIYVQKNEAE